MRGALGNQCPYRDPEVSYTSGDFSFTLYPLPRIALYYIFYLPDEEFPAAVSCLFPANVIDFLPLAGLADVAEYTARKMIELIMEVRS